MSVIINDFTKDFQITLLANIASDDSLIKIASKYLVINDFDISACQLVYEALLGYYDMFHKRPPMSSLVTEIESRLTQPHKSKVQLLPEEYESLSIIMERIINPTELDPKYYEVKIMEFIRYVRGSRVLSAYTAQPNNANVDVLIDQVNKLSNLSANTGKFKIAYSTRDIHPIFSMDDIRRISTGQPALDSRLSGGLVAGGLGMITACPGVGKTTSLINFGYGATRENYRSLLITLELVEARITHRYQSIAAGIPASYFNTTMDKWPDDIMLRFSHVVSPEYQYYNYFAVVDSSTRSCTCGDIDSIVDNWITETRQQYGENEAKKCKVVLVDWLDKLDPGRKFKDLQGWELYPALLYELSMIARKYGVAMWTATQGKASADSKENLRKNDVAGAYHKNDALDLGLGVGVVNEAEAIKSDAFTRRVNDEAEIMQECSRKLSYCVNKNRDGGDGSVILYQGPSLKLFTSQQDWLDFLALAKTGDIDAIFEPKK